ncbi:MAG: hypothetical protein IPK12_21295 [Gemmatimonadetes bacterium]|nr:hypothetical protein [Gemmatimonadota bacterium]
MRLPLRWVAFLLLLPAPLVAQGSLYVPLDDPRLPLFEHLVRLGDVPDPSPQVRPFRRADALAALDSGAARGTLRSSAIAAELRSAWSERRSEAHWSAAPAAGVQAYTEARRDPLQPGGPDGANPYVELALAAAWGPIVAASRPAIEPRLPDDPDWPGRKDLKVTGRHADAYLSAQWKWARLFYGQTDRNWGPVGFTGIPLSNYGYPRPEFAVEVGGGKLRLSAHALTLTDAQDTSGQVIHRYFFAHRLDARPHRRLALSLWETILVTGPDRSFDGRYRNPVALLLLANQYGLGAEGNVMVGADVTWQAGSRTTLAAQVAVDDIQYQNKGYPNRYAFTLQASGALRSAVSWRAGYTQASSLAFRTANPFEAFTEHTVGLGRPYADSDQLTFVVSAPLGARLLSPHHQSLLLEPELTLLRRGESRLSDPWPSGSAQTPTLLVGTTERTWRAALGLSGRQGPVALRGSAGLHYLQNADHVEGRTRTEFAGRLQLTVGHAWSGDF